MRLEPLDRPYHRTSASTARIINTVRELAAGLSGSKLSEKDLMEDDALVPKERRQKRTRKMNLEQAKQHMRMTIGV